MKVCCDWGVSSGGILDDVEDEEVLAVAFSDSSRNTLNKADAQNEPQ
jgi:hypothetical protein